MSESFCVAYKKHGVGRPVGKLSRPYESLQLAIAEAVRISTEECELVQLRGSHGTVIPKQELERLIARAHRGAA